MGAPRLADRVYSDIVVLIGSKDLKVGDRLPSEAALGETLCVSRTVVREALVHLASDGITEARVGAGSFVIRRPSALLNNHVPPEALPSAIGTYEVRFVLEAEAARLASLRRSDAAMVLIDRRLADLKAALLSSAPAHTEDMAFHREIMLATGNPTFVQTFDVLGEDIVRVMEAGVEISRARPPETIAAMLAEHEDIAEAIRLRDSGRAALSMHWHLSQGRRRLMP